jgi:hypothetical protein
MKLMKVIQVGMAVMAWYERASADGKITSDELIEGIKTIVDQDEIFDVEIKL